MKEVKFGHYLRRNKELFELASARVAELDEVLEEFASEVSAEWDVVNDGLIPSQVTLRLEDFSGSVTGVFSREEMKSPEKMRSRLGWMWTALLQVRSQHLLEAMKAPESD